MTDWQDKVNQSMKDLTDKQEAMVAKTQEGMNAATESFEKFAKFHMEMASEAVELMMAQLKLLSQPGNPAEFVEKQVELVTESFQKASARASELSDLITARAGEVTGMFQKAVEEVAEEAAPVAAAEAAPKAAAKPAKRTTRKPATRAKAAAKSNAAPKAEVVEAPAAEVPAAEAPVSNPASDS